MEQLAQTEAPSNLWLLIVELIEGVVDQRVDVRIGHSARTSLSEGFELCSRQGSVRQKPANFLTVT